MKIIKVILSYIFSFLFIFIAIVIVNLIYSAVSQKLKDSKKNNFDIHRYMHAKSQEFNREVVVEKITAKNKWNCVLSIDGIDKKDEKFIISFSLDPNENQQNNNEESTDSQQSPSGHGIKVNYSLEGNFLGETSHLSGAMYFLPYRIRDSHVVAFQKYRTRISMIDPNSFGWGFEINKGSKVYSCIAQ